MKKTRNYYDDIVIIFAYSSSYIRIFVIVNSSFLVFVSVNSCIRPINHSRCPWRYIVLYLPPLTRILSMQGMCPWCIEIITFKNSYTRKKILHVVIFLLTFNQFLISTAFLYKWNNTWTILHNIINRVQFSTDINIVYRKTIPLVCYFSFFADIRLIHLWFKSFHKTLWLQWVSEDDIHWLEIT